MRYDKRATTKKKHQAQKNAYFTHTQDGALRERKRRKWLEF
jgi:hypothetical protein